MKFVRVTFVTSNQLMFRAKLSTRKSFTYLKHLALPKAHGSISKCSVTGLVKMEKDEHVNMNACSDFLSTVEVVGLLHAVDLGLQVDPT